MAKRKLAKNSSRARKWTRVEAQEELAFIQDTLTGKLSLNSFNDSWAVFSRYAKMQAGQASHSGFPDIADVIQASANRAARKAVKKNPGSKRATGNNPSPLERLRYHVSGAIARGEKHAITEKRTHPIRYCVFAIKGSTRLRWTGLAFSQTAQPALYASKSAAAETARQLLDTFAAKLRAYSVYAGPQDMP